jgi:phenylacetate-coenzyme A ligase PaaK-like adenylate-forming protein
MIPESMTLDELMHARQYSLPQEQKERLLLEHLNALTARHRASCEGYDRLVRVLHHDVPAAAALADVPYIPVGILKTHELRSIAPSEVFRVLTSSGTTGQRVSRVYLDRATAMLQSAALSKIMIHVLGPQRLPMLLIESPTIVTDRTSFSARGAGALGMMNFGRAHCHALDEQMQLQLPRVKEFLARFGGQPFLIFGFTFMVWAYFYQQIKGLGLDLSNGTLVHSGGWKKLIEQSVTNDEFKAAFRRDTGLHRIYNFYGMVEQVGSVFMEGEDGYLYPPNFADIVIRDPMTWNELPMGKPGVIEVLSLLPQSYPGHAILTEDLGVVEQIDGNTCGRMGKAFRVLGRLPKAELRGCSDTHAAGVSA